MSTYLSVVEQDVRYLLKDTDRKKFCIDREPLRRAILRMAQTIGHRFGFVDRWITDAVALSDTGSPDFPFTASDTYIRVIDLRRQSDGGLLTRRSEAEIEGMRSVQSPSAGTPTDYYLIEEHQTLPNPQRMKVRLWPRPNEVDKLDAFVSTMPGASDTNDTSPIPFGELLVSALEWRTAALVLAGLPQSEVERLGINPEIAKNWSELAQFAEAEEESRIARQSRVSHIPAVVN